MYKHRHVVTEHKTSRDLHTMAKSNGHRTAEPVCSVKHGEGLIIITRLDTGAAPVLSLARTLSRETHTLVPFIRIHTHTHTHTHIDKQIHTVQMGNQRFAPGGKKNAQMVS